MRRRRFVLRRHEPRSERDPAWMRRRRRARPLSRQPNPARGRTQPRSDLRSHAQALESARVPCDFGGRVLRYAIDF